MKSIIPDNSTIHGMKSRNEVIDIMRAICAIYIIAIFHLNGYYSENFQFSGIWEVVSKMLTIISLGGFTFISGYCLSKYSFKSFLDIKTFYKRRLSRFYLLYFLAAVSLFMMKYIIGKGWFEDKTQFLLTLVGLSSFYNPIPHTLWYFGMIMFFYLITPLLNYSDNITHRIIVFFIVLAALVLYDYFFYVDNTLFLYFPFYFLGLLRKESIFKLSVRKNIVLSIVSIICLCVLFILIKSYGLRLGLEYLLIPLGLILLISISRVLVLSKQVTSFFTFVSTASMVAYLFHRHFYGVVCLLFSGNSAGPISPVVGLIASILLFVISYYVQFFYNRIINTISKK